MYTERYGCCIENDTVRVDKNVFCQVYIVAIVAVVWWNDAGSGI